MSDTINTGIDGEKLRQVAQNLRAQMSQIRQADEAAAALAWFGDYAHGRPPCDVIRPEPGVVASSTGNVELAKAYLRKVFTPEFCEDVIKRAIKLALEDLDAGVRGS